MFLGKERSKYVTASIAPIANDLSTDKQHNTQEKNNSQGLFSNNSVISNERKGNCFSMFLDATYT